MSQSAVSTKRGFVCAFVFFAAWGCIFLNRLGVNYAANAMIEQLDLSSFEYSALSSVVSLTAALSAVIIGPVSDRFGRQKQLLVIMILLAGVLTFLEGFCSTVMPLLILRGLFGLAIGGSFVLMMVVLSFVSKSGTFGRNGGIINTGPAVIAGIIGPVVVTQLATNFSWQTPFLITGVLLVLSALLIQLLVPKVDLDNKGAQAKPAKKTRLSELFRYRNFALSCITGLCAMMAYWTILIYGPLYLTEVSGFSVLTMGLLMSVKGFLTIPLTFIVPTMSDWFGRKPVAVVSCIVCIFAPLTMLFFPSSIVAVITFVVLGGTPASLTVLFNAIIPMETLPESLKGTGSGFSGGFSEVVGGSLWPLLAAVLMNGLGLPVVMGISGALMFVAAVTGMFLKETNPRKLKAVNQDV